MRYTHTASVMFDVISREAHDGMEMVGKRGWLWSADAALNALCSKGVTVELRGIFKHRE